MVLAEGGWPSTWLVIVTLIGGTLAAGGANAINMYVDRDIDRLMVRTRNRPLVTGVIAPRDALVFAVALEIVAFAVLWAGANLLSAVLALSATAFYVGVYTIWLKRTSTQNIVIGGAAGAVPVLVGWAAVQNDLELDAGGAVRRDVLLDPAALLGARHPLRRRLPRRQRADAAGGRAARARRAPDDRAHAGDGGLQPAADPGCRPRRRSTPSPRSCSARSSSPPRVWLEPQRRRRPTRCACSATRSRTSRCCSRR